MNVWVEAARPRTLPASAAPVLVGTAAGAMHGGLVWWRFALALLVALAVQVAVNYANDYFDGVRGVDTVTRAGPRRAVASGLISPPRMLAAVFVALLLAAVAGIVLAASVSYVLFLKGPHGTHGVFTVSQCTADGSGEYTCDGVFRPDQAGLPAQDGSMTVEPGKTVRFRYRVVIHPGDFHEANIAELYKQYAAKK